MLRSVIAVLSGPVVFGAVCVPTNYLIVKLFPSQFDKNWVTTHTGLLALLVGLTLLYAGASGFVGASIARDHVTWHIVAMCVLQLAIGIAVQRQSWDALPLWYHYTFFALLVLGILLGAAAESMLSGVGDVSPAA